MIPEDKMIIKVISLKGCGAIATTITLIKEIAQEMGLRVEPEAVVITTLDEAKEYRHIGGPTVQINGLDMEPEVRNIDQFGIC